ncbi:dihydrodipicolinate synthase family protein [Mesorhizobium sp. M2D.F.Ca.ET.185.01.1.1]|uniref:dihydrodipicolinate synthase family protein n=1 Tax=unclassified Mesorhizobium TaxID=325217 RepID=UPI000FCA9CD0|nr:MULTISPECIES: dihydrodipicolinate synthase family protein [unclassified Mesorhizobium]TGP83525.1 dihydrodipicolinate synthase family protein [bacterium M00.F.Ca.ET.227.01.1.1]TGP99480.1 dihydrodipicolinate synthase family protein [bacterium M00.F.Ca.ET.221.01.1.1]TGQ00209.1 dihydrodipicolinate synthase family protein [bacterium M00.F.Ca.ET.222.01.1.1]TGT78660.1 dihydrodipicolinate synthase family protein [bacterium M00.F.Ca.ET.159.01.1.1]TGT89326.1 dihydrodipicolinate synthase family protei
MWTGVFPAVTTKFTADDRLDHAEMERCYGLQMEAGCDGIIVCGSLGEGPMLSPDEKIEVLKTAQKVAGKKPVLLTVNEPGTREAASIAKRAAKEGADGLMVVPSPIYHTDPRETVAALRAVAEAGDLPVMIYSNRLAYRVDVTVELMEELASDKRFVAIKESSDDIRRSTEIINRFGDRYDLFTGVDNLAFEALSVGAIGWVAGLVTAFPRETVAIYQLMREGRREEALSIYRWFRPLLDLDVSTYLVQNIKLAEVLAIGTNDRVRMPRQPLSSERRKAVEKIIRDALAVRPKLPSFQTSDRLVAAE